MNNLSSELEALLTISANELSHRQLSSFDESAGILANRIVLFGCGGLGRKTLSILRKHSIEPLAFSDNNSLRWDTKVDDLLVRSPEQAAKEFGHNSVFVVTIASPGHSFATTNRRLRNLGCGRVVSFLPLLWKYADDGLPYYAYETPAYFVKHAEKIKAAFALLGDEKSRRLFIKHLQFRLTADLENPPQPDTERQYFPSLIKLLPDEVFLDCGAYDGDTIRPLLAYSPDATVYAFEPDPGNFRKLGEYVETLPQDQKLRLRLFPAAVDQKDGKLRFAATGAAGATVSSTGNVEIPAVALDAQNFDPAPTFIKMDIEGAEQAALSGAENIIRRHKPLLAICAYHRPDDLWELTLQMRAFSADYAFYLRCYDHDGWETVLYAIDKKRLIA